MPADLNVGGVDLSVNESQGPWLVAPSGLWQASGWVRDQWQLVFYGDSPSGVCSLSASINGQAVTLGPGAAVGQNSSTWHQCAGASASPTIQTADYGQGAMPLVIEGCDAAGACTGGTYAKTIQVDNTHPSVSLQSAGDVPVTAGAQYVTATAGGSPSGIAEIDCSVDGGPTQRYAEGGAQQPSAQVPVSGLGVHTIQCSADEHGGRAGREPRLVDEPGDDHAEDRRADGLGDHVRKADRRRCAASGCASASECPRTG